MTIGMTVTNVSKLNLRPVPFLICNLVLHVFQALLENSNDCCERIKRMNETCANISHCDPGMFQILFFKFQIFSNNKTEIEMSCKYNLQILYVYFA